LVAEKKRAAAESFSQRATINWGTGTGEQAPVTTDSSNTTRTPPVKEQDSSSVAKHNKLSATHLNFLGSMRPLPIVDKDEMDNGGRGTRSLLKSVRVDSNICLYEQ
jgi:hypothetical protein